MLISWNTTQACNISCLHCYRDAGACLADELTTEEGKRLLDDAFACGFRIFVFSRPSGSFAVLYFGEATAGSD